MYCFKKLLKKTVVVSVCGVSLLSAMEPGERPSKRQKCEDLSLANNNGVQAPSLTIDSVQGAQESTDLESLIKSFNERCKKDQQERLVLCKEQSSDDVKLREILHGYAKHALDNPRWHASQRQILPYLCMGNNNFKNKLAAVLFKPIKIKSDTVNFNATASGVSHDQKLLVLGNNNGDMEVYDIGDVYNKKLLSRWNCIQKREEMGSDFTAKGHEEEKYPFIAHMAINPDHTMIAVSHNNGEILLWNVSDFNNPIFLTSIDRDSSNRDNVYNNGDRYAGFSVDSLDFSSNGNILLYEVFDAGTTERNVCLWNIENINDINFIGMLDREGMGDFVLMNKTKNRMYHFFNEASGFDDSRREIYCLDLNASPAQIAASMGYWHEHDNFVAGGYCDFEAIINKALKDSHQPECIDGFSIAAFAASEDNSLFAVLCYSACDLGDECGGCSDLVFMFDVTDIKNIRFINFFDLDSFKLPRIKNQEPFLPEIAISVNKQQLIMQFATTVDPTHHEVVDTISVLDISDLKKVKHDKTYTVSPGTNIIDVFCIKNSDNELFCVRYRDGLCCWNMASVGKHIQDLTNGPLSLLHCTLLKDLFKRWDEFVQHREDQAFWNDRCNDFMSTLSEKDRASLEEILNELEEKEICWTPVVLAEDPLKKIFQSLPRTIQQRLLLFGLVSLKDLFD